MVVILESSPPISVADLARRIGKRPDTLYHHLRTLRRAGLVEPEARPSTGGRPGSVWRLKMRPVRVATHRIDRGHAQHAERLAGVIARAGLRDYRRAMRRAVAGEGEHPMSQRSCVWLTPAERRRFEDALLDMVLRIRARKPRAGRTPHVLTLLLSGVACSQPQDRSRAGRQSAAREA